MDKAKQLIKHRIIEFKDKYGERATADEICLFLGFQRQNLQYKPKNQSIEDAYVDKIENMSLKDLGIWKINHLSSKIYGKN